MAATTPIKTNPLKSPPSGNIGSRWGYSCLYAFVRLFHYLFYRRFTVRDRHSIPKDKPVIFLANHQNALMDALGILYGVNKPVTFMARADIFKNPKVASLLYFLKIMPIYRPRDGMENMEQNDTAFQRAVDVLRNRKAMAMFPEGAFNPHKNLFPFKKGFARIAFMSEQATNFSLDLQVVPVGIDYTDKKERNAELLVQFGTPIPLSPLLGLYQENPAQAYLELCRRVRAGLLPLIINIEATEYHETYMRVFELCECDELKTLGKRNNHYNRFVLQQHYTQQLNKLAETGPESMKTLQASTDDYYTALNIHGINDAVVRKKRPALLSWLFRGMAALLLIIIYPFLKLPHWLPLLAPRLVLPKIKDPQFILSVKYAVWLFASLLYYPVLITLLLCFVPSWELKIISIITLIISGLLLRPLTPLVKSIKPYFHFFSLSKKIRSELYQKRIKTMNTLKKLLLATALCMLSLSLWAQEETDKPKERVKEKFSFGVLPTIAYDADLGFQYGGLVSLYDYRKPVRYPDYRQMWKVEISRYTKGSGTNQVYYDAKNILPYGLRLVANLAYITEQRLDFFGFNGYQSTFNPDYIDDTSPDYISRAFYGHERNQLRFNTDLIGHLPFKNTYWLAGFGIFHTDVSTVDINKLNKGEDDDKKLPDVPLLYDNYVTWGLIPQSEKDGGFSNYLKIGALYDTRDMEANASHGIWAEATLTYVPSFLFNDGVNYLKAELAFRHYLTFIPDKLTFAYRLMYQGTLAGHTPFYMQPYMINAYSPMTKLDGLGGARSMRGVMRNRVVGDGYVLGNAELRWKMFRTIIAKQNFYFALHAFADAGMVVQQLDYDKSLVSQADAARYFNYTDYSSHDGIHPAAGLSLRIAMNENFILAIDYGFPFNKQDGQGGGLFINIGNLF